MSKNVTKASLQITVAALTDENNLLREQVAGLLKKLSEMEELTRPTTFSSTTTPTTPPATGNGTEFSSLPVSEAGRAWIAASCTRAIARPDGWVHIAFPRKDEAVVVRLASTLRDRGITTARVRTDASRAVLQFKR